MIAAISFGAAIVVTKRGLREMSSLGGASISITTTAILLWTLTPFLLDLSGWHGKAVAIFAGVGLFFPAAVTLLNFESNRRMGPTTASTVSGAAPLFAVTAALIFLHETLTWLAAAGIAAIVTGVMVLSLSGKDVTRNWPLWVLFIPIGGAAFRGSAQASIKLGLDLWRNPFAAALIGYTVSAVAILFFAFLFGRNKSLAYRSDALPHFTFAGILNGFGLLLSYEALGRGQVTTIAPILATFPVFTFFLSAIFLRDERVTAQTVVGVLLTVAGVTLIAAR